MSSKQHILDSIRRPSVPEAPLPTLDHEWIRYPDRHAQFVETLKTVGGQSFDVDDLEAADRQLAEVDVYAQAKKVCSLVPGVGRSGFDLDAVDDPHELEDVDFAILPGQLAVAENAAVWVTDAGLPHRVLYFLVQHLALVVPSDQIVDNLHDAYGRLAGADDGPFRQAGFGCWISGPSKTADIEQSLVIGAHGPRSLTVFLLAQDRDE